MERPTCETCSYWNHAERRQELIEESDEDDPLPGNYKVQFAECHRHPPLIDLTRKHPEESTQWPELWYWEWCGEHPDFPAYIASLKKPRTVPEMEAEIATLQDEIGTAIKESMEEFGMTVPEPFNSPVKEH